MNQAGALAVDTEWKSNLPIASFFHPAYLDASRRFITNILRAVGALAGVPDLVTPPTIVNSFDWLRSPVEGIFHPRVEVGQMLKRGDVVGELVDLVGDPLATLRAQTSGVLLFIVTSPAIKKDGLVLAIGGLDR